MVNFLYILYKDFKHSIAEDQLTYSQNINALLRHIVLTAKQIINFYVSSLKQTIIKKNKGFTTVNIS